MGSPCRDEVSTHATKYLVLPFVKYSFSRVIYRVVSKYASQLLR